MSLNYEPIYSINSLMLRRLKGQQNPLDLPKNLLYIFGHKVSLIKPPPPFLRFKIALHLKEINIVKKWI